MTPAAHVIRPANIASGGCGYRKRSSGQMRIVKIWLGYGTSRFRNVGPPVRYVGDTTIPQTVFHWPTKDDAWPAVSAPPGNARGVEVGTGVGTGVGRGVRAGVGTGVGSMVGVGRGVGENLGVRVSRGVAVGRTVSDGALERSNPAWTSAPIKFGSGAPPQAIRVVARLIARQDCESLRTRKLSPVFGGFVEGGAIVGGP